MERSFSKTTFSNLQFTFLQKITVNFPVVFCILIETSTSSFLRYRTFSILHRDGFYRSETGICFGYRKRKNLNVSVVCYLQSDNKKMSSCLEKNGKNCWLKKKNELCKDDEPNLKLTVGSWNIQETVIFNWKSILWRYQPR